MNKHDFINFMYESGVLTFGDFTLKSSRKAPYFVNTGNYRTGEQIGKLGEFYAQCIVEAGLKPDVLYGPAYKGIPLCVAAAIGLAKLGVNVDYCFNRKEAKDHGEGGVIVGHQLKDGDKVLIIEDVITAGTAIRETLPIIKSAADVDILGVVISIDRMEKGKIGDKSAVQEVNDEFGIKVYNISSVVDIIDAIKNGSLDVDKKYLDKMLEYRKLYGVG
ncbi:MAG: orotate phosphoribosyltransferase [Clostridiales bacterium]|nr:orotate phosphoribosyltransferase [Clostridiales bacterium]